MNKIDIIKETAAFYSEDTKRRSLDNSGACVFNGNNDTHCAVGRFLLAKFKEMGQDLPSNSFPMEQLIESNNAIDIDDMLEPKYRGHDFNFWRDLQWLHDNNGHWTIDGITINGEREVNDLLEKLLIFIQLIQVVEVLIAMVVVCLTEKMVHIVLLVAVCCHIYKNKVIL